jgi:outer membrane biosynthesis protein TonB
MSTAASNPPLPDYSDLRLRKFLVYSLSLHIALVLFIGIGGYLKLFEGKTWSGVGGEQGGTRVKLVSSAGIPMPRPVIPTESRTVDPTQGLYKVEPPKLEQPPPDATKLPSFDKKKPLPPPKKSKILDSPKPPPDNAFYGESGTPDIKSGYSQNPGASSGVELKGQGGGDFASLYPWYVEALKNRISQNWDQTAIDPALRAAHRGKTTMVFRIARNGAISNIALSVSSGNRSLDYSAQRTLLSLGSAPPLPADYRGSYVDVIFDFDLSLQ